MLLKNRALYWGTILLVVGLGVVLLIPLASHLMRADKQIQATVRADQQAVIGEATLPMTIMGKDLLALDLDQQNENWIRYQGGDSPEGAFSASIPAGAATLQSAIILSQTIPVGRYYIFIKGINYDTGISVRITDGRSETTLATNDRDWNGYWTNPGAIELTSSTNVFTITIEKLGPLEKAAKYLLRGIYLASHPNEVVLSSDVAVDLTYPTTMDHNAAVKGNLLDNSSFEVGAGYGWGLESNRNFPSGSIWDRTIGYHGRSSIKIPLDPNMRLYGPGMSIISKVYTVKPNKRYTLSAWVKTTARATVNGSIGIANTFVPPAEYPPRHELSQQFTATDTWQRVSVTGYLLKYPTSDYQIVFYTQNSPMNYLWIDAVQLEEGELTDYKPSSAFEVGVKSQQSNNIFYEDEPVAMQILTYNANSSSASVQVDYKIYAYTNQKIKDGSQSINVPSLTTVVTPLDLYAGKRGIFRLVVWIRGREAAQEEIAFSIIPRPQTEGADVDSTIGIHSDFTDYQIEALQKIGFKWDRAMSPAAFFRWSAAEPVDDQFVWRDDEVQRSVAKGMTIMGTIGTNDYWPAWADNNGLPNLDKWEEFVDQIVSHYKGSVRYWEIWNEPSFEPAFYAQMLKRASDAIERADPNANIIGMGGVSLTYMEHVIAELERQFPEWPWHDHIDALSTHLYPTNEGAAAKFKTDIIDRYNIPVWNTETGVWDRGVYMGSNSNFVSWGHNLWPQGDADRYYSSSQTALELLTKNFLSTIGSGLSKYFYYDARIQTTPAYHRSHPTLLEYDDTIRPKGVAYAILARFFDHAKGLGQIAPADSATRAYLFERNSTPLVALWSEDGNNHSMTVPLEVSQYTVYDVMGNKITPSGSTISYGRMPVYIEGHAIVTNTLRAALAAAITEQQADTAAPHISLSQASIEATGNSTARFRWIALDDISVPSITDPYALLFSYQLAGLSDTWSNWTPSTYVDYSYLPEGAYTFRVKAKDAAGNESEVVEQTIHISHHISIVYLPLVNTTQAVIPPRETVIPLREELPTPRRGPNQLRSL